MTRPQTLLAVLTAVFVLGMSPLAQAQPRQNDDPRAGRKKILERHDADRDGRLSDEERRKLRDDLHERRLTRPAMARDGRAPGAIGRPIGDSISIQRDVEYGQAGDRQLKLDIIRPKDASVSPRPAIVFIHGGGWRRGDKAGGIRRLAMFAASGDYFCASVGYRLTDEATWPAQIHDCKAAIRFLKAKADEYNIDPKRIGVWGTSAGGHLVSMLGYLRRR